MSDEITIKAADGTPAEVERLIVARNCERPLSDKEAREVYLEVYHDGRQTITAVDVDELRAALDELFPQKDKPVVGTATVEVEADLTKFKQQLDEAAEMFAPVTATPLTGNSVSVAEEREYRIHFRDGNATLGIATEVEYDELFISLYRNGELVFLAPTHAVQAVERVPAK